MKLKILLIHCLSAVAHAAADVVVTSSVSGPGVVPPGTRLELVCTLYPVPPRGVVSEVEWSRVPAGALITNSVSTRSLVSVLTVDRAAVQDSGTYTCQYAQWGGENRVTVPHYLNVAHNTGSPSDVSSSAAGRSTSCGDCSQFVPSTDCRFFECIECVHQCGSQGYPVAYGRPMCERFKAFYSLMYTESGQSFLNSSLLCLMSEIVLDYGRPSALKADVCGKLMQDSHEWRTTCFVQSGYCRVVANLLNWWALVRVFNTRDIWTWKLIPAMYNTDQACRKERASSYWTWFKKTFSIKEK